MDGRKGGRKEGYQGSEEGRISRKGGRKEGMLSRKEGRIHPYPYLLFI